MDIILTFIFCFVLLIFSVLKGVFVGYPLMICLCLFIILSLKRGYKLDKVLIMVYEGGKKSFIVLKIFILIGAITSIWMASGTVSAVVYYGMEFLNPKIFILSAFLISSLVSFLIGTSFGTIGTAGVALMVMARSGGISPTIVAGAVLSGAYFGDRCSPMSSSANLVASLTETDLYTNIKNMFKSAVIPFIVSVIIYLLLSIWMPLNVSGGGINSEIAKIFNTSYITLIPALIIIVLSFFKVNVKLLMLLSIIAAIFISIYLQHYTIIEVIKYIIFGYNMENDSVLKSIIKGGGILSMLKVSIVVFVSSAFTGIFEGTSILKPVENLILKSKSRYSLYLVTFIVSICTSAFGCTQTLAVILAQMLVKEGYESNGIDKYDLALDLENTSIVIAPLIPWNIALLVPVTNLSVGFSSAWFAFYLYLIPITGILLLRKRNLKGVLIHV